MTPQPLPDRLLACADALHNAMRYVRDEHTFAMLQGVENGIRDEAAAALSGREAVAVARAWRLVERWKSPVTDGEELTPTERLRNAGFAAMLETALSDTTPQLTQAQQKIIAYQYHNTLTFAEEADDFMRNEGTPLYTTPQPGGREAVACDACGGTGEIEAAMKINDCETDTTMIGCPDCGGAGTTPQPGDGVVVLTHEQLAAFASKSGYSLEEAAGTVSLLNEAIAAAPSAKGV